MKNRLAQFATRTIAILALAASIPTLAFADPKDKMDAHVRDRASRITGSSRVIVEFYSEPDVKAFGRGTAGRKVGSRAQVAEVENTSLITVAGDSRVKKVWLDRLAFAN